VGDPVDTIRPFWRYLLVGVIGALFALAVQPLWSLEGRWFVVAVVGIALVSISMLFAGRFSDFLLVVLLFTVPLAGFAKWTFLDESLSQDVRDAALYTGTLGIGILDFVLVGLYFAWGFRVVAMREPLPRLDKIDGWVALIIVANVLSQWGAMQPLALFALEHQVKYALVYFYIARHFRRDHLPWFMAAVGFAILVEGVLGALQFMDVVPPGLILDKGAGSEKLEQQYVVPGLENVSRATGSLYDSHALGTYLAMLIPFILVFLFKQDQPARLRLICAALMVPASIALVVTYSRSAWLAAFLSSGITMLVLIAWRERYVAATVFMAGLVGVMTAPWVLARIFARFFEASSDLLLVRFEQFPIAWSIWQENFLFGSGAGNYMVRMEALNTDWSLPEPVHNVPLFIGAELGLLGVIAYYGLVLATLLRLWQLVRQRHAPYCYLALAAMAGIVGYIFDGMSNPLFREPTIYMCFWVSVALAVALTRLSREDPARPGGAT
jgi:O-antigen ligase